MALKLLKAKLRRLREQERLALPEKRYDKQGEVTGDHQVRRYALHPRPLVRDLRTGAETADVAEVLDGGIDLFLHAGLLAGTEGD